MFDAEPFPWYQNMGIPQYNFNYLQILFTQTNVRNEYIGKQAFREFLISPDPISNLNVQTNLGLSIC